MVGTTTSCWASSWYVSLRISTVSYSQYTLPSAPQCQVHPNASSIRCDPYIPPYWGYLAPPPSPDPRTGLIRHDLGRRMGDPGWWWTRGDIARHQKAFKLDEAYLREWRDRIEGCMWDRPEWMEQLAGRALS